MPILLLVVIGAAAGFLASRIMRIETGTVPTILFGIAGALLGGLLIRFLLAVTGALAGFVGAVLGAMLLLWIWKIWLDR